MYDEKYHKVKFLRELNDVGGYENKLTVIKAIKQLLDSTETNYKMFNSFHLGTHHLNSDGPIRGIPKGPTEKRMQKIMVHIVKKYVVNIVGRRMVIRIIIVIQVVILKSVIMMGGNVSFKKNRK